MAVVVIHGFSKKTICGFSVKTKNLIELKGVILKEMLNPVTELKLDQRDICFNYPSDLLTKKSGENIAIYIDGIVRDAHNMNGSVESLAGMITSKVKLLFPEAKNIECFINMESYQRHAFLRK